MRCDQFEERLNEILDRRKDPRGDRALTAHWAACDDCRSLASAYTAIANGAALLHPTGKPAPELASRRFSGRVAVATLLTTAAAWACIVLANQRPTAPTNDDNPPVVVTVLTTETPAVPIVAAPAAQKPRPTTPIVFDLARTTGPAVGLIHRTARGLDEALALATALPPPHQLLEPVLFPEDGLLREMEDRWVPAAGETLDAIRHALQPAAAPQL